MLSAEQIESFKENPKEFLAQYKYLDRRAEYHISRVNLFSEYEYARAYCREHLLKAKALLELKANIEDLINKSNIKPNYKEVLRLHYLEGFSHDKIGRKLFVGADWVGRLQKLGIRALRQEVIENAE